MVIVSQDKSMIINFNSIVSVYVIKNFVSEEKGYQGYNIDFATNEEINFVLATYETKERAKEVLQEIAQTYSSYLKLEGGPAILQGQIDIQPNIFNIPKVYEMPTE